MECVDGRRYAFEVAKTALLVIDMQRDFLDPAGMSALAGDDISELRAVVPILRRVLEAARKAGLRIIHTREGYAPDLADVHRLKAERGTIGERGPLGRFLVRDEPGHEIVAEHLGDDGSAGDRVALPVSLDDRAMVAERRLWTPVDQNTVGDEREPLQRALHRECRGAPHVQPLDLPGRRGTDPDRQSALSHLARV